MLEVGLLGTGGMMPLPYRWLTSLMVRYNGMSILIDCGEGTQVAMKKKGWSPKPIDVICFTHFHADHISGLPGLLLSMGNAERTEPLLMIGPKGLERVVNSLRVIAPDLPFEIRFHEIGSAEESIHFGRPEEGCSEQTGREDLQCAAGADRGKQESAAVSADRGKQRIAAGAEVWVDIPDAPLLKDLHIEAFRVNHNVTCYGYTILLDRTGRFDVERATALGIPRKYWNRLQKGACIDAATGEEVPAAAANAASSGENAEGKEARILTPDMVLGPARRGLKVTYTTDTRPCQSIVRHAQGSDLFICEGMYAEEDKLAKAREHRHMMFSEAAALARDAAVKELWLTHYSPSLIKPETGMDEVRKIFPHAVAARDGRSVDLIFEED